MIEWIRFKRFPSWFWNRSFSSEGYWRVTNLHVFVEVNDCIPWGELQGVLWEKGVLSPFLWDVLVWPQWELGSDCWQYGRLIFGRRWALSWLHFVIKSVHNFMDRISRHSREVEGVRFGKLSAFENMVLSQKWMECPLQVGKSFFLQQRHQRSNDTVLVCCGKESAYHDDSIFLPSAMTMNCR